MKNFLYPLIMLFAAISFVSCGGDDDDPIGPGPNPDNPSGGSYIEKTEKLDDAAASTINFYFMAKASWRATGTTDWCSVTPNQGTPGDKTVSVSVAENFTTEERTCVILFEAISGESQYAKLTITQPGREVVYNPDENDEAPAGMKLNASGLVKQIKVGWNLGNTCESDMRNGNNQDVDAEGETAWGNPKTTKTMITALKDAGFNAIRIPCRWYLHADEALNIRQAWLNRVKEIVDYAVSQDMYVVLNSHHDNWYDRLPVGYNEADILTKFENMWKQIATMFKDYDEHLIFAGTNEIIKLNANGGEDWGNPTSDNIKFANNLMQLFVDVVRSTGGNNKWRCLMVQPWAASPSNALNSAFAMPDDKVANRLILEYHCYDPYNYATAKDNKLENKYAQHDFKDSDKQQISKLFQQINQKFVLSGVPCIMAEFGSTQDNSNPEKASEYDKTRADYHTFIVSEAKKYGIPGFYWDNGSFDAKPKKQEDSCENFGLLDRNSCTFPARAKIALDGIMAGLAAN